MIDYLLPESVDVGGESYKIRTDYRAILDIIAALNDPELDDNDKAIILLNIFYLDSVPTDVDNAIKMCFWFINGGENQQNQEKKPPKLVDWEKDFRWIAAPINKSIGRDIRGPEPLHWWTFLSYYYEIGDCMFAQIVRIRDMQSRGKKLDKSDREWLRRNADLVRLDQRYTAEEEDLLAMWAGGGAENAE